LALAITEPWQYVVLAGATLLLLVPPRNVMHTLVAAAAVGTVIALLGGPLPN
jgi:chromate transporter